MPDQVLNLTQVPVNTEALSSYALPPTKERDVPTALFRKHVFKKGESIPENLKVRGCFAVTRDTGFTSLIHIIVRIVQAIHHFLFGGKNFDPYSFHSMILLGRDNEPSEHAKNGNLLMAHAVGKGLKVSSYNYLMDRDVTEVVIYEPIDEKLRDLIAEHAESTAYNSKANLKKSDDKPLNGRIKKASYAKWDAFCGAFHKANKAPNKKTMLRTSQAVADLLVGNQLLNDQGKKPHNYFCSAYTSMILQASLLIQALSEKEMKTLRAIDNREERVKSIFDRIVKNDQQDPLSKVYWNNKGCQLNGRFALPAYFSEAMTNMSVPAEAVA